MVMDQENPEGLVSKDADERNNEFQTVKIAI